MTTVTPYLCAADAAAALDFYAGALGAEELYRLEMGNGGIGHAEMRIGDTVVMLSDEWPEGGVVSPARQEGSSTSFTVTLDDPAEFDAWWSRAVAAGVTVEREPSDQFYGHRTATFLDPFGHRWSINAVLEEVSPEEMQRRLARMEDEGEAG